MKLNPVSKTQVDVGLPVMLVLANRCIPFTIIHVSGKGGSITIQEDKITREFVTDIIDMNVLDSSQAEVAKRNKHGGIMYAAWKPKTARYEVGTFPVCERWRNET